MPAVESLAERYGDRVRFVKVNAPENRKVCRDLRVAGLPAYLTMRDGVEVERLTGNGTTAEQIEEAIETAAGRRAGGGAAGARAPAAGEDERRRTKEVSEMELRGKKVIALGERDSVPGEAIAEVARSAGAEVIEVRTECFV